MTTNTAKVTIHMVSSLDGFIAKKENSVSWLESSDSYEKGIVPTEEDMAGFTKAIDCYIMAPGHMNTPWNLDGPMATPLLSY